MFLRLWNFSLIMSFDYDIFGIKRTKKQKQRDRLEANKRKGRAGEEDVKLKYMLNGWEIRKTGKGHDFVAEKRDNFGFGRVIKRKYVEVKTGNAKQSKLQRKTKPKVERVDPLFY
jgi:hypothetical protein